MREQAPTSTASTGNATREGARGHGRVLLLLLALLFVGPLLLAVGLYYGSHWRPTRLTNHGVLIQPPRTLSAPLFQGKWSLVYVGGGDCGSSCRRTLYYMQQTHLGLGRLYTRAQRVFIATSPCCDRAYLAEYPGLITVDAAAAPAIAALLPAFPADRRATGIFIIDPHGNLMMRYDATSSPTGLLIDLKQLLNLSSIG